MESFLYYLLIYLIGNVLCYNLYLGLLCFFTYCNKNYIPPKKFDKRTISYMVLVPLFSLWASIGMIYRIIIIGRFKRTNVSLYEQALHILNLYEKGYITVLVYLEHWGRIYDRYKEISLLNKK